MALSSLALQFPGQGSQEVGMGEKLCQLSPAVAAVFAQADEILGFPLSRLCFEGPAEALNDTINTQPAILTTSVAALRAMEGRLEKPAFVAGHSLGEFSALVAAGALAFEEALWLVRERGRLMKEASEEAPGGMIAVLGLERAQVEEVCARVRAASGGHIGIANDNCPGQLVVSGDEKAIQIGMEKLKEAGARKVVRLAVSIAAHSPLMAGAAVAFRRVLARATILPPRIPFIANATARPVSEPEEIRELLSRQLTSPVRWADSVRWMVRRGARRFVEVGPGKVLTGLLRRIAQETEGQTTEQVLGSEV